MQRYTFFDFILLAVAVFLIPAQSVMSGRKLAWREPSETALLQRYVSTLVRALAIILYIIALWRFTGRSLRSLGLGAPTDFRSLIGFIVVLALAVALALQHVRLAQLSSDRIARLRDAMRGKKIAPRNGREFSVFSLLAVTGAFSEELLFRGFLLWFFSPVLGVVGAALCSTVIFGLGHAYQGRGNVMRTGVVGGLLAAGYVLTGNLWWLIVAHGMMNVLGGLFSVRVEAVGAITAQAT